MWSVRPHPLAVVVEQIPAALRALGNGAAATLDFYEQGIERMLTMEPTGTEVAVECQSMTSWQPEPSVIRINSAKLLKMLSAFLGEFVERAQQRCPELVEHPWFREWIRDG